VCAVLVLGSLRWNGHEGAGREWSEGENKVWTKPGRHGAGSDPLDPPLWKETTESPFCFKGEGAMLESHRMCTHNIDGGAIDVATLTKIGATIWTFMISLLVQNYSAESHFQISTRKDLCNDKRFSISGLRG